MVIFDLEAEKLVDSVQPILRLLSRASVWLVRIAGLPHSGFGMVSIAQTTNGIHRQISVSTLNSTCLEKRDIHFDQRDADHLLIRDADCVELSSSSRCRSRLTRRRTS
jgi:hypothetical protein